MNLRNLKIAKGFIFLSIAMTTFSCSKEEIQEESNVEATNLATFNATAKTVKIKWKKDLNMAVELPKAVRQAKNNGIVELPEGTFNVNKAILLPNNVSGVTIKGKGRNKTIIKLTKNPGGAGVIVTGAFGTKYQDFAVDGNNIKASRIAAISSNGKSNVQALRMRFLNAEFGFGNAINGSFVASDGNRQGSGLPITGLTVNDCVFSNCSKGIAWNRVFSRSKIKTMPRIKVINSRFIGKMDTAITMDAGNDGTNGNASNRVKPEAKEADNVVTDLQGMLIKGNYFGEARLYNVALARVNNVVIEDNEFRGTGNHKFSRCLNIEHRSSNIRIWGNKFFNKGVAGVKKSHILIPTFTDYGNAPAFKNGCKTIRITRGNTFTGKIDNCISGELTSDVLVSGNTFNAPKKGGNFISLRSGGLKKGPRGNRKFKQESNTFKKGNSGAGVSVDAFTNK